MTDKPAPTTAHLSRKKSVSSAKQMRDDRLKAALKANLARRKGQARARNAPIDEIEKETEHQATDRDQQKQPGKTEG
jgi:hypothetical protein